MKKRNTVSFEVVKALFDPAAESESGGSSFRVNGGPAPVGIAVPRSVMHRLFHLGHAYGIRQFRYFEPGVKLLIGSVELPEFVRDLRRLRALINDEVLHEYVDALLVAIEAPPGYADKNVAVSVGDEFNRRV